MTFVCSNCGNENPDGSVYCNRCGARMGIASSPPRPQKQCPRCSSWNETSRPICFNCGENLTYAEAHTAPRTPTRYCAWCGTGVGQDDRYCPVCRHDPSGALPARMQEPIRVRSSQKPKIAGALMVGAGILEVIYALQIWMIDLSSYDIPAQIDVSGFVGACGTIVIVLGLLVALGSFSAFRKDSFVIAISATIAGFLGIGLFYLGSLLSFIALILIVMSRDEFRR